MSEPLEVNAEGPAEASVSTTVTPQEETAEASVSTPVTPQEETAEASVSTPVTPQEETTLIEQASGTLQIMAAHSAESEKHTMASESGELEKELNDALNFLSNPPEDRQPTSTLTSKPVSSLRPLSPTELEGELATPIHTQLSPKRPTQLYTNPRKNQSSSSSTMQGPPLYHLEELDNNIEFSEPDDDAGSEESPSDADEAELSENEEDESATIKHTPILPRKPKPGVLYTTPHQIAGTNYEDSEYDVPVPRLSYNDIQERYAALGTSRLTAKQREAMKHVPHNLDPATIYPDQSDMVAVEDWYLHGPQCWEYAPDLCTFFTMLGNRYQAPSTFQIKMLTTMPIQRLPELSQTFLNPGGPNNFNWQRNDNIDSVLAYMCGIPLKKKDWCGRCKNSNGMMVKCVRMAGFMKGACSNCWKNSKQAQCKYYKSDSTKTSKATKKRTAEEIVDLTTEPPDVTPRSSQASTSHVAKKRKQAQSAKSPSPTPTPSKSADWGVARNTVEPEFRPRFTTSPATGRKALKATPKSAKAKGKERAHTPDEEPPLSIRTLDELRHAGLILDETKLQDFMQAYATVPTNEIQAEKHDWMETLRKAAVTRRACIKSLSEAEHALRQAREVMEVAEKEYVSAEKNVALLSEVRGVTKTKLTLGGF